MTGRAWAWPVGGARWRKPALIGASVTAHALMLGVLVAGGIGGRMVLVASPPPPLYVEIEPRPLLEGERPCPRPTSVPKTPADQSPAPTARTLLNFRLPFQRDRNKKEERQPASSPAPRLAAPGVPAPPAGADSWQVRPETLGDRIGRGLRTRGPGCTSPQVLSREERALCEDRFGERAAAARPIEGTGHPDRDARFARQGAQELSAYAQRREVRAAERPVCEKTGPIVDCEVEISVDLFSSIDGFLPNQRREE